jgi:hypothetical protein
VYLLTAPAPDEGVIFGSLFLLDIAVLKGVLGVLGSLRIFIIVLYYYTTFGCRRIALGNSEGLSKKKKFVRHNRKRSNNSKQKTTEGYLGRKMVKSIRRTSRYQDDVVPHAKAHQAADFIPEVFSRQFGRANSRPIVLARVKPQLMGSRH